MDHYMLTTTDNPYNPFTQFDEWFAFDERHGYHTCGYIARIAKDSSDLSPEDQNYVVDQAMNEIAKYNIYGNYVKVKKPEQFSARKT